MRPFQSFAIALSVCLLGVALPLRSEENKTDPRLLGIWVSDREKTVQHLRFNESATPEQRAKFAEMFGKLKIEYTTTDMRTEYEGKIESGPYKVIASDKDSVVILGKEFEGPKLIQIHFMGDSYYVLGFGYVIEFFKRLKPNPSFNPDAASTGKSLPPTP